MCFTMSAVCRAVRANTDSFAGRGVGESIIDAAAEASDDHERSIFSSLGRVQQLTSRIGQTIGTA